MLKAIAAVVVGYLVMAVVVFLAFIGLYRVIGPDRVFLPATYYVSPLWIGAGVVVNLVAAVAGGAACAAISRGAVKALAGLVFVLGIAFAIPVLDPSKDPRPIQREAGTPDLEAMTNGRQPVWVALSLPFIGAVGAIVGGARGKRR